MERVSPIQALKLFPRSFIKLYEHLGNVMVIGITWLLCCVTIILAPPATAAVYYTVKRLLEHEEVNFKDSFIAFKKYFLRSWGIALWVLIPIFVLIFDFLFFATVPKSHIVRLMSGFLIYPMLFILITAQYATAVMIIQNSSVLMSVKRAALLAIDNLPFTILLGIPSLIYVALGAIVPPFLVLAFMPGLAFLQVQATNDLLNAYEGAEVSKLA